MFRHCERMTGFGSLTQALERLKLGPFTKLASRRDGFESLYSSSRPIA